MGKRERVRGSDWTDVAAAIAAVAFLTTGCSKSEPPMATADAEIADLAETKTPESVPEPESAPEPEPEPESEPAGVDAAIAELDAFIASKNINKTGPRWKTKLSQPPVATFTPGKTYYWNLTTTVGAIKIRLMPDVAPMHVSSTIYLTRLGFYDGLLFHRVMKGFMAQGGDPLGTGMGGPGYSYDGEISADLKHDRPGLLSMANTGRPTSDGSQFFITFVPYPSLNGKHTIFGEVADGMTTVKALERNAGGKKKLAIERATITVE